jgi:DNA-binding Xre family transcriptional regulator
MLFKRKVTNFRQTRRSGQWIFEWTIYPEQKRGRIMDNDKNSMSTFEKEMQDPHFKAEFEKEYQEFLISEFLIEAMEKEHISVRKLAEETGISASMIQKLRSGENTNISLKKLVLLLSALHYQIKFEKVGA